MYVRHDLPRPKTKGVEDEGQTAPKDPSILSTHRRRRGPRDSRSPLRTRRKDGTRGARTEGGRRGTEEGRDSPVFPSSDGRAVETSDRSFVTRIS